MAFYCLWMLGWIVLDSSSSFFKVQRLMFQGPAKILQGYQILLPFLRYGTVLYIITILY